VTTNAKPGIKGTLAAAGTIIGTSFLIGASVALATWCVNRVLGDGKEAFDKAQRAKPE